MVNYQYLYTRERTSHLMRFYNRSSGKGPGKYQINFWFTVVNLLFDFFDILGFALISTQQFRGTSFSAWHWSKHGKSGKDGQRHDKGIVLALLNNFISLLRLLSLLLLS